VAAVWRPQFLRAFAISMNWSASAQAAGITRQTAKAAYANAPEFRKAVDEAQQAAIDSLELTAIQRATTGASDRMLEFMLRSHKPETYDLAVKHQLSGPGGGPINLDLADNLAARLNSLATRLESSPPPAPGNEPGGPDAVDPEPQP
jgi:hypothetical protein